MELFKFGLVFYVYPRCRDSIVFMGGTSASVQPLEHIDGGDLFIPFMIKGRVVFSESASPTGMYTYANTPPSWADPFYLFFFLLNCKKVCQT